MSGKKVFRNLFAGKPVDAVPMLLPVIPLGAKIMQISTSAVAGDPALAVQSALQIKQLLAPQGMVVYDPSAIIEALGGQDRAGFLVPEIVNRVGILASTWETTQRLSATLGKDVAVFAATPGPAELLQAMSAAEDVEGHLNNTELINSLGKFLIDLAKEHLENGADGLVVVDRKVNFAKTELGEFHQQFITTMGNIAAYYGIPLVLYLQGQEEVGPLTVNFASLDCKGMLFDGGSKPGILADILRHTGDRVIGLTVPEDLLLEMSEGIHDYLKRLAAELPGKRLMLSVPWTMTEYLSVTHIVGLNKIIQEAI